MRPTAKHEHRDYFNDPPPQKDTSRTSKQRSAQKIKHEHVEHFKVKTIKTYDYNTCQKEKPKDREFKTGCREYDYTSLNEFIEFGREQGLTHITVDNNPNRAEFLKDIFYNEEKMPYLTKIYDSSEHGYEYHVKIFSINYEKFE